MLSPTRKNHGQIPNCRKTGKEKWRHGKNSLLRMATKHARKWESKLCIGVNTTWPSPHKHCKIASYTVTTTEQAKIAKAVFKNNSRRKMTTSATSKPCFQVSMHKTMITNEGLHWHGCIWL